MIRTRAYAYQWVRNVSFSETFAYVTNEWSLTALDTAKPEARIFSLTPMKGVWFLEKRERVNIESWEWYPFYNYNKIKKPHLFLVHWNV